jgi:hypothetical protein
MQSIPSLLGTLGLFRIWICGAELLRITDVLLDVIIAAMGCLQRHEGIALAIDFALSVNRNIFCVLGDEHAQHCAFAGDVDSVMTRETEGRAGQVVADVMASNQRGAALQQQMNVAVELHGSDDVAARREVDGASALLHACSDGGGNGGGVEADAIALRAEIANVADR